MRFLIISILIFFFSSFSWAGFNDFDLSNSQVPLSEFLSGGPPKDEIPALSEPEFIPADQVDFLEDRDLVLGVSINGESKAYPISILNWHEIVNDQLGAQSVAVTWCPLTKSGVVFDREVDGQILEFGVSGLLYNSNVVMYDRTHQGLWSQLNMGGLTGKYAKRNLSALPSILTSWAQWVEDHPKTLVLSKKTGHRRDYHQDPYSNYHQSSQTMFPINNIDQRLSPKSVVLGVKIKGMIKAYPMDKLRQLSEPLEDKLGDVPIRIYPTEKGTAYVADQEGRALAGVMVYWFAWSTFYPNTLVYSYD